MEKIDFYVPNNKVRWYKLIAIFFLLFNLIAFGLLMFYELYQKSALWMMAILVGFMIAKWFWVKNKTSRQWIDESVYFISFICWMTLLFYILALICLAMGILFLISKKEIHFVLDEEGVTKQNFPAKFYPWNVFSNVILKDGLLTLDFVNNHFMQFEVKNPQSISETDFNKMVSEKIQSSTSSI